MRGAATAPTCFPLACLDIHHRSMVLFCEVFEQDHVVLFVGVVDKHCLGAHTQHLTDKQRSHDSAYRVREHSVQSYTAAGGGVCSTYLREAH